MAPPEFVSRARCPAVAPFKERPMLFSAPMVRALLDGTKTQTRRVCKPAEAAGLSFVVEVPDPLERGQVYNGSHFGDEEGGVQFACPHGGIGNRLWVRETFQPLFAQGFDHHTTDWETGEGYACGYPATSGRVEWIDGDDNITSRCKPAIHMPRWASRIDLEITGVRVERLHDISDADALAEGITSVRSPAWDGAHWPEWRREFDTAKARGAKPPLGPSPSEVYRALWEDISSANSWAANPWVWAVTFRRIKP